MVERDEPIKKPNNRLQATSEGRAIKIGGVMSSLSCARPSSRLKRGVSVSNINRQKGGKTNVESVS